MRLFLVHHGDALAADLDSQRPLSPTGREQVSRLAAEAALRGAQPDVVWHSGKLRARQTAEEFWRSCSALAEFSATRDLQPADPPQWFRERLRGETRDVLIAGHFPHIARLLELLLMEQPARNPFPLHGVVALETIDEGATWSELWRIEPSL